MRVAIDIIFIVVVALILGNARITFSPFSIHVDEWYKPVGMAFVALGVFIYVTGEYYKGYHKGFKKGTDAVIELIKNEGKDVQTGKNEKI